MARSPVTPIHGNKIQLQSYASEGAPLGTIDVRTMRQEIIPKQDARRAYRERFGKSLSMDRIEVALLAASRGSMQQLTDISRETIDTDPHLASVLTKRFGAVSSVPWEVQPATGYGIDKGRAMFYAAVVREQLKNLPNFRQFIKQLAWAKFDGRVAHEIKWSGILGPSHDDYGTARWAITKLDWIHPRRLNFGPNRETRIVSETGRFSSGGGFLPVGLSLDPQDLIDEGYWRRFVSWRPQSFGEYPEREGLAPRCMYWSFFKRFAARDRMWLMELFGKPWRILEIPDDSTANREDLTEADTILDALGSARSARLPRGTKLNVVQPSITAGAVHQQAIEESDKQISKIVLGQTGTTDGVSVGLGSQIGTVMKDEQLVILKGDGTDIGEEIETQLCDAIIEVNFGPQALPYSPRFVLRTDIPADREKELDRLNKALAVGIEVSLDEAYDVAGFRAPETDEPKIRLDQPPTPWGAPNPPNPRPVIVYPPDLLPEPGLQTPPTAAPTAPTIEPGTPGADETPPPVADEQVEQTTATRTEETIQLAALPRTGWGSPEDIEVKTVDRLMTASENWAAELTKAIDGKETPSQILIATTAKIDTVDKQKYADALSEGMLQAAALGALDNATDSDLLVAASKTVQAANEFSEMAFRDAMDDFAKRSVVTKAVWRRLMDNIYSHSFTVAGIQSIQMLRAVHDELTVQISKGADLRFFAKWMVEKLRRAGFLGVVQPATGVKSASHIQTVFRTNVQGAYNAGRVKHASQPEVLKLRPIWEIRAIVDRRTRDNHRSAHGRKLRADDPWWQKAYPPFGFNCRCTVISRPATYEPTPGSWQVKLPDPGFISGIPSTF